MTSPFRKPEKEEQGLGRDADHTGSLSWKCPVPPLQWSSQRGVFMQALYSTTRVDARSLLFATRLTEHTSFAHLSSSPLRIHL